MDLLNYLSNTIKDAEQLTDGKRVANLKIAAGPPTEATNKNAKARAD